MNNVCMDFSEASRYNSVGRDFLGDYGIENSLGACRRGANEDFGQSGGVIRDFKSSMMHSTCC